MSRNMTGATENQRRINALVKSWNESRTNRARIADSRLCAPGLGQPPSLTYQIRWKEAGSGVDEGVQKLTPDGLRRRKESSMNPQVVPRIRTGAAAGVPV